MKDVVMFKKGWSQVRPCDRNIVKSKLMDALGVGSKQAFYKYMAGDLTPKVTEYAAISMVFAEFGIYDVWGKETQPAA